MPAKPFDAKAIALNAVPVDVNHDGHVDLLMAFTSGDSFYVYASIQVLINNGDGTFRDETAKRFSEAATRGNAGLLRRPARRQRRPHSRPRAGLLRGRRSTPLLLHPWCQRLVPVSRLTRRSRRLVVDRRPKRRRPTRPRIGRPARAHRLRDVAEAGHEDRAKVQARPTLHEAQALPTIKRRPSNGRAAASPALCKQTTPRRNPLAWLARVWSMFWSFVRRL
jgi:hypothetical protein